MCASVMAGGKYSRLKIYAVVLCQDLLSNGEHFALSRCKLVCISTISSSETILSAKMSFGHHFMSSVDHSAADAMKPSISKGYHLGSVNSSLVNLYLTPPLSQLCHPLFSSVSVAISIHQSSTDSPSSHLKAHTPTNVCTQDTDFLPRNVAPRPLK